MTAVLVGLAPLARPRHNLNMTHFVLLASDHSQLLELLIIVKRMMMMMMIIMMMIMMMKIMKMMMMTMLELARLQGPGRVGRRSRVYGRD